MVVVSFKTLNLLPNNFTGIAHDDISKCFKKNKSAHRYYGPAILSLNGNKEWCFNGKWYGDYFKIKNFYSQKQFIKDLSKLFLI